jgi:hypothetical protein
MSPCGHHAAFAARVRRMLGGKLGNSLFVSASGTHKDGGTCGHKEAAAGRRWRCSPDRVRSGFRTRLHHGRRAHHSAALEDGKGGAPSIMAAAAERFAIAETSPIANPATGGGAGEDLPGLRGVVSLGPCFETRALRLFGPG